MPLVRGTVPLEREQAIGEPNSCTVPFAFGDRSFSGPIRRDRGDERRDS